MSAAEVSRSEGSVATEASSTVASPTVASPAVAGPAAKAPEKEAEAGWRELIPLYGERGRSWMEHYRRPLSLGLEELGVAALGALRRGQLEFGRAQLAELERGLPGLAELDGLPLSVRHIHDRWYHGVLAYHEYAAGRPKEAEGCLQAAFEAVRAAIAQDEFLILFANHCQEFRLHQARIARSRNDWRDVKRYVHEAARMIGDETPLCVLEDGRPIFLADMQRFCEALPRPAGTPPYLRPVFDRDEHRRLFESFVEGIYMLPGLVILYP